MFSMIGYQKAHAYAPEHSDNREGGMVFGGGAPAQPAAMESSNFNDSGADDSVACP
jgi:hypothetical protein